MEQLNGLITKKVTDSSKPRKNEKDIFVHITAIQKSGLDKITEGQELSFDIVPDRAGRPEAHNLSILKN